MKKLQSKRITDKLNNVRMNVANLESENWANSSSKEYKFYYDLSFSLEKRFLSSRNIPLIEAGSFIKISDLKMSHFLNKYSRDVDYVKISSVDVYKFEGFGYILRVNIAALEYIDEFFLKLELGTIEEEEALKIVSESDLSLLEYLDM